VSDLYEPHMFSAKFRSVDRVCRPLTSPLTRVTCVLKWRLAKSSEKCARDKRRKDDSAREQYPPFSSR